MLLVQVPREQLYFLRNQDCSVQLPCLAFFESLKNHMHIHTHNLEVVCLLHNFRIPKRWQSRDWTTKTHNLKIVHMHMYVFLSPSQVCSKLHTLGAQCFFLIATVVLEKERSAFVGGWPQSTLLRTQCTAKLIFLFQCHKATLLYLVDW